MAMIQVSEDALESIKRMAEQDAKDAARYRWLREGLQLNMADSYDIIESAYQDQNMDAAIDAAMQ